MQSLNLFDLQAEPPAPLGAFGTQPPDPDRPGAAGALVTRRPPTPAHGPTVLAVDGNSLAHRAFHAYAAPNLGVATISGRPRDDVGAGLYGILALLAGVWDRVRPAATIVGFDCREHSERKARWPGYKAQRAEKDAALDGLLDAAPALLAELGAAVICPPGWEADDVLGSVAAAAEARRWRCVVATSDRDAYALIGATTSVLRLRSGIGNAEEVTSHRLRRQLGIAPDQYLEYGALRGDTSDNLPGISGIGPRRARELLRRYPSVSAAVADPMGCRSVLGRDLGQALLDDVASADSVFARNVALMTIRRDLPVDLDAGLPRTSPARIDRVLRARRLAGLVARMTLVLGHLADDAPPLDDRHAPHAG